MSTDSDGLGDIIAQTLAGNTAGGGVAPQPPNAPYSSAPPGNTGPGTPGAWSPTMPPAGPPSQPAPGPAPEANLENFRWEDIADPAARNLTRGLQADYTRKMQAIAEERRALEEQLRMYQGLSPETAQTAATIEQLQRENPTLAGHYMQQMAARLLGGAAQQPPPFGGDASAGTYEAPYSQPDPYPAYEPDPYADPVDRRLAQIEHFFGEQQRRDQERDRREQERAWGEGLARVQQELGRALTPQELARTANVASQRPGLGVEEAYVLAHRKELEARYLQRGRDEALQVRQQQQGLPPPPAGAQSPQVNAHEPNWNDPAAVIRYSIEQARRGQGY